MPYLTCPTCGLMLAALGSDPDIDHCPRCRARRGMVVEMIACRHPSAKPGPGRITDASPSHARRSGEMRSPLGSLAAPPSTKLEDSHAAG